MAHGYFDLPGGGRGRDAGVSGLKVRPTNYSGPPKGDQNGFNRSMRHEARAKAGMQGHAAGASGGHGGGNPNHDEHGRFT